MKDAIEELITRVRLAKYVSGGKQDIEESPKGKSPSKTMMTDTSRENKETNKGKRPYISAIIRGAPQATLPSKGTKKRTIIELMAIYRKEGNT